MATKTTHTPGVHVAFTERVTENIRGFEVCTVSETDKRHHPKLLAIARKYEDALLYSAAPDMLTALTEMVEKGEGCAACGNEGRAGCGCRYERARAAISKAKASP